MSSKDLSKLTNRLMAEKRRLEAERARLMDRGGGSGGGQVELADYDVNHPADAGTELFDREKDLALMENVNTLLDQVNGALAKIAANTYGICDVCGAPIPETRLRALPYATMCVSCQSRYED
jgi:phage/conjugal plasmid C-4 type zinc finger TraR family protein